MNARELNKRIEIRATEIVSDGYGGNTVQDVLISNSWAKIESLRPGRNYNLQDFGLTDIQNSVLITVRKRNDLVYDPQTMYFVYRGKKYTISTAPTNVNFEDAFIVFVGTVGSDRVNVIPGEN